jgi:tRNA pseudouridine55 synthase
VSRNTDRGSSDPRVGTDSALSGFLLLYKPVGPGSQALLGAVRRLAGTRRVGHGGTLDPFASGLLPVAVGRATRLIDRLHSFPKTYEAELRLGIETDTLDLEGRVLRRVGVPELSEPEVDGCLSRFVGLSQQLPPAYSAARVGGGRRAYDAARAGEAVELEARQVEIHQLSRLSLQGDRLRFRVTCSSGTYVRSLGRDIAAALGTAGHLTRLVRTAIGPLALVEAQTVAEVEATARELGFDRLLLPPDVLLVQTPALVSGEAETQRVLQGAPLLPGVAIPPDAPVRAYEPDGTLLALLSGASGGLAPKLLLK